LAPYLIRRVGLGDFFEGGVRVEALEQPAIGEEHRVGIALDRAESPVGPRANVPQRVVYLRDFPECFGVLAKKEQASRAASPRQASGGSARIARERASETEKRQREPGRGREERDRREESREKEKGRGDKEREQRL